MNRHILVTFAVLAAHLLSSAACVGTLPFYAPLLSALGDDADWAGIAYGLPIAIGALCAPLWGTLSDRGGSKTLLLRSHLGLAVAFSVAALADNTATWIAAIALQGFLGGSFAASKTYLAGQLTGPSLAKRLDWLEGSARLALVIGPIAVGAMWDETHPTRIYRTIAFLPLLSAITLAIALPRGIVAQRKSKIFLISTPPIPLGLPASQFLLGFGLSLLSPYFLEQLNLIDRVPPWQGGLLFALPHLVYLGGIGVANGSRRTPLRLGWGLLAIGSALHYLATGVGVMIAARITLGLGLLVALRATNRWTASAIGRSAAGAKLGWMEAGARLSAALGGIAASWLHAWSNVAAPEVAAFCCFSLGVLFIHERKLNALSETGSDLALPRYRILKKGLVAARSRLHPLLPTGNSAAER